MRGAPGWLLVGALLVAAGPATAGEPVEIRLTVGSAALLKLGFVAARVVCDDTTVVRIEERGDHVRLEGRAVGRSRCRFWRKARGATPTRVYDVVVAPRG